MHLPETHLLKDQTITLWLLSYIYQDNNQNHSYLTACPRKAISYVTGALQSADAFEESVVTDLASNLESHLSKYSVIRLNTADLSIIMTRFDIDSQQAIHKILSQFLDLLASDKVAVSHSEKIALQDQILELFISNNL